MIFGGFEGEDTHNFCDNFVTKCDSFVTKCDSFLSHFKSCLFNFDQKA
nr:MAG TPA: hypothetical protein [Caudoviricetes sp.]